MIKKAKTSIKDTTSMREKILKSMIASFRIEGINISDDVAAASLKKISLSLEK